VPASVAYDVACHILCVDNLNARVDESVYRIFFPCTGCERPATAVDLRALLAAEVIHLSTHTAIHSTRPGLPACSHKLSTVLCTGRLDDAPRCHKTGGAIRHHYMDDGSLP
jgi:hypothetical protein